MLAVASASSTELHIFCKYGPEAGGARVRVFDWLTHTNTAASVQVFAEYRSPGLPTQLAQFARKQLQLEQHARKIVGRTLIYKQATPFGRGRLEAALLQRASVGLFDFDDAIHLQTTGRLDHVFPPRAKTIRIVKCADRVIAGNATLADWASQYAKDVVVIPSCVETGLYETKTNYAVGDRPIIGWIGSKSTEGYLDLIQRPLLEIHRRTGARLVLIGASKGYRGDLEVMIDRVPWSEENQAVLLKSMDVGVMPLANNPYERGKCAYKLLQYGAAGVPAIGSPVGVNGDVLAGSGGWMASSQDEWLEALTDALEMSEARRTEIGVKALRFVTENFSFSAWRSTWESLVVGRH
jgi:glycosyltransferase involved in cell wall biosynthesis